MTPLQGNLDFFLIRAFRGPFRLKHKKGGGGVLLKTSLSRLSQPDSKNFSQNTIFAAFNVDESDASGSNLFYTKQSL